MVQLESRIGLLSIEQTAFFKASKSYTILQEALFQAVEGTSWNSKLSMAL